MGAAAAGGGGAAAGVRAVPLSAALLPAEAEPGSGVKQVGMAALTCRSIHVKDTMAGKETPMTIELNEEQRQALAEAAESPLRVIDPASNTAYVLVRADV